MEQNLEVYPEQHSKLTEQQSNMQQQLPLNSWMMMQYDDVMLCMEKHVFKPEFNIIHCNGSCNVFVYSLFFVHLQILVNQIKPGRLVIACSCLGLVMLK